MNATKNILIIKPSSLGDVVHALPVLQALKEHWPQSSIAWVVAPAWRPLLEGNPYLDRIISFERECFGGILGVARAIFWLRGCAHSSWRPDLAIDLQGLLRSAIIGKFFRPRLLMGLSDAREGAGFFYNAVGSVSLRDHAVNRYLGILRVLGITPPPSPQFWIPAGKIPEAFSLATPYYVVHPYARGAGKSLSSEALRGLIRGLMSHGEEEEEFTTSPLFRRVKRIVIVGKGELDPEVEALEGVENWSNRTTLLELIAVLRHASGCISSDSGPMHLAAVLHPRRVVAIHRWSDPLRVGPYFQEAFVWKSGLLSRVSQLNERARLEGSDPTEVEMELLGKEMRQRWR